MKLVLACAIILTGCTDTSVKEQYLPSRPIQDLFPQANSPSVECPKQYPYYIVDSDGTFFIYCFGKDNWN